MAHPRATLIQGALVVGAGLLGRGAVPPSAQGPVTFSEHVAPIVFANCTPCHRPGEAAPFPLMSYRDVRPLARAVVSAATGDPARRRNRLRHVRQQAQPEPATGARQLG